MSDLLASLRSALGDRYRIDRELPGGGMSRVFVAEELALGRPVVLKVLPPEASATVNADRFRREVQFAAKLQHPHIVPVLSTGEDAGTLWYSMPYVEGDSLRTRVSNGALPLREALTMWQHMLDALSHAHRAGIVHRDMKPDNVLVSGRNALVTDFGIAKAVASATAGSAAPHLTGVGFVVGTPAYMAPEQAAGVDDVDARADIYSAALVAYELLTGKAAFAGLTPPQTLAAQVQTMPASPRVVNPAIPADIDALLMRCLAKDPQARPASADAVLEDLDQHLRGVTTPSRESVVAKPPRSRAFMVIGAAVAIVAVIAAVLNSNRGESEATVPRDLVVLAALGHDAKDSSVARALSEALRIDLQQSPRLNVADPQLVRTTLQAMRLEPTVVITDSIAKVLGVRLGAKAYVTGTLSTVGGSYVLTARLVSVSDGTEISALRETADGASGLLNATDRLSKALREQAGESVASLRASPALPTATTANLEALEHYAAGLSLMREGKQVRALAEYEKAVALDSMFASAWSGVSTSLSNLGARPGDMQRAAQRAFDLRAKLPELERLRLEARYYSARGETANEIAAMRRILSIDPKQYAVLNNLGRIMFATQQYAAAESLLKAAVQVQPGAIAPTDMLFGVAAETGNRQLQDSLVRAIPAGSAGDRLRISAIEAEHVSQARYVAYAQRLDSVLQTSPDLDLQGLLMYQRLPLYVMQGQIRATATVLDQVVAPIAKSVDPSFVPAVQLNLAQAWARFADNRARAMQLVRAADAFYTRQPNVEDRAVPPRAWTRAILGDPAGARRVLAEQPDFLPKDSLFRKFVDGEIALAEGNAAEAVRLIRPTIGKELFCAVCGMGALARAYDALGQRDSVLAIYTRLLDSRITNGRLNEDALERAQALKRTGELLEERGDARGALARYREFVELWDSADVELQPVVREVRDRITRLAQQKG